MPIHTLEDEMYRIYDTTVAHSIGELALNRSPYHGTIRLIGFNRKNKEHLFVLKIALMVRDLYQVPVEVGCKWWEGIIINWNIRKGFRKVDIVAPFAPAGIWVPGFINKIKVEINNKFGCDIDLGHVYDTYYEGSCN